jgi:hypothetical protein
MLAEREIAEFESEDLISDEVAILDAETTVFLWVGADTTHYYRCAGVAGSTTRYIYSRMYMVPAYAVLYGACICSPMFTVLYPYPLSFAFIRGRFVGSIRWVIRWVTVATDVVHC